MAPRWFPATVVLFAVAAAGCSSLESSLLYHPTPYPEGRLPRGDRTQDVALRTTDGTRIHAWWCPCPDARGEVLVCHGNAGNLTDRVGLILALQESLHHSVLIFDYPGFGRSEGSPSEPGCYAAADAAYDWLVQQQHAPADRLIIFGESLGGGVAVDLAARRPHRALCLARTFTSVPDVARKQFPLIPVGSMLSNRFDNLGKIRRCSRPVFIAHGTEDRLIPFAQAERLFAAAREPKQFWRMESMGHNDPLRADFFSSLGQFLETSAPLPQPKAVLLKPEKG